MQGVIVAYAKKGRRQIEVDGKIYYWWHRRERSRYPTIPRTDAVSIVAEDGRLYVDYHDLQPDDRRYARVSGPDFTNIELHGTQNVACWHFDWLNSAITPRMVRQIVDWATHPTARRVLVDDDGIPLTSRTK